MLETRVSGSVGGETPMLELGEVSKPLSPVPE